MSRSSTKICGICQTRWGNGNCFHIPGAGTEDDPFRPEPVVDTDADNLVECGPSGIGAFLPPIYRDPPACSIYSIISQVVPYSTMWPIVFDRKFYDTDAMFDLDNFPSRIGFKTQGLYLLTFNFEWFRTNDDDATGEVGAYIRVNGVDYIAWDSFKVAGDGDDWDKHSVSVPWPTIAGGYAEATVKHTVETGGGNPRNMRIVNEHFASPSFSAVYLRPLDDMNVRGIPESE